MKTDQSDNADQHLDDFFEVDSSVPAIIEEEEPTLPAIPINKTELQEDFDVARKNISDIVEMTQDAMEEMIKIAKQMGSPRGYEAYAKLLNSAILANKGLVELHKNKQDVDDGPAVPTHQVTQHNTVFMTTTDMQNKLEEARKNFEAYREEHSSSREETAED